VASFERRQGGCCCGAAVQESSIDTAEQLKEASVKGFTDDAHLADLVRQLIASMNE
jgi:acetaldehyde dehydrogenase (acetylating)